VETANSWIVPIFITGLKQLFVGPYPGPEGVDGPVCDLISDFGLENDEAIATELLQERPVLNPNGVGCFDDSFRIRRIEPGRKGEPRAAIGHDKAE